jgi:hypothetical protein
VARFRKRADVIGKSDNLAVVSRRKLLVCERDRVDAACYVIQRPMDLSTGITTFLNGNRSQDELEYPLAKMIGRSGNVVRAQRGA